MKSEKLTLVKDTVAKASPIKVIRTKTIYQYDKSCHIFIMYTAEYMSGKSDSDRYRIKLSNKCTKNESLKSI